MAHLWLAGMMGTGKTTVGVLVAELTGRPFVDVDVVVMERSGRTIPELFDDGEETFREWEAEAIREIAGNGPSIIATGGGAVMSQTNVDTMRASGHIVLLTAPIETIVARIEMDSTRPLATSAEAVESLARLRRSTYEAVADCVVDTAHLDIHSVAEEVFQCVPIT